MIFEWLKKKEKDQLIVMDIRSTNDNPFLETRTAIMIRDIKQGYILYSHCDYESGEWLVRKANHSMKYEDACRVYSHIIERGGRLNEC